MWKVPAVTSDSVLSFLARSRFMRVGWLTDVRDSWLSIVISFFSNRYLRPWVGLVVFARSTRSIHSKLSSAMILLLTRPSVMN